MKKKFEVKKDTEKTVNDDGISCYCCADGKGKTIVCKKHRLEGRK